MRTSTRLLRASLGLAAIGLALVLFHPSVGFTGLSMGDGDNSDGYSSSVGIAFTGARIVTTQELIGFGLIWLASLIAVGVLVHRGAIRLGSGDDAK